MTLANEQYKELVQALSSAFPTKHLLAKMVRFGLDEDLAAVDSDGSVTDFAFNLVGWAEAQGKTVDLIRAALAENPGNPELREFAGRSGLAAKPEAPPVLGSPTQGKCGVLIDVSHGQAEWELNLFQEEGDALLQQLQTAPGGLVCDVRHVRRAEQIKADALKEWHGLIFCIPHHVRIDETVRFELARWVRQGGHLVLLGFELGERHHETNLNELAGEFGIHFNSDIVAPEGWNTAWKPYGEPIDFSGIKSSHRLLLGVTSLRLLNLCTLSVEPGAEILFTLGDHVISRLQRGSFKYTSHGWIRGGNPKFDVVAPAPWVPVMALAPKGLTGAGSVLAIGTWELFGRGGFAPEEGAQEKLFAVGFDNQRFVENLLAWCIGNP